MKTTLNITQALCLAALAMSAAAAPLTLTPIGRYTNDAPFNVSASEIVKHDPATQRLYVVNARDIRVDVLDIRDPATPTKIGSLDLSSYGKVVNSVDISKGLIAVAVEANVKTDPGVVVIFDRRHENLNTVTVGALPDMVTFTPDGRYLLCANEGEPDSYNSTNAPSIDPEGSVSIIDISRSGRRDDDDDGDRHDHWGVRNARVQTADFRRFNRENISPEIRIYGPNATVPQDLEPEYITVSANSQIAWVTLQENNALAMINIKEAEVIALLPLGYKDHNQPSYGLDASDQDNRTINIRPWPLKGIYNPDGIASYKFLGATFLVLANEGDTREWPGFREDVRFSTLNLDPTAFPDGAELKKTNNLGRLAVSSVDGDTDGDGDFDEVYSYGARSFSIRTIWGQLIFDSGDHFEQLTAQVYPANFNASHSNNTFDNRSPSKGPEPEGLAIGRVDARTYAFVGFERVGGVAVYDITNPFRVSFVTYHNNRKFQNPFDFATEGDLGPEGLHFISAADSPIRKPLLIVANEVSGSTLIYRID